jgi:hypothetical protein
LLYERDLGLRDVNVGAGSNRSGSTGATLGRDRYARAVLAQLNADHTRLGAAATACRIKLERLHGSAHGLRRTETGSPALARCPPGRIGAQGAALRRAGRVPGGWRCAIDLCERARRIVEQAGAVNDDTARRRLLAGTKHQLMRETLGGVPDAAEQRATPQ